MSEFNLDRFKVIGFDLDDTLHFYKNASRAASQEVLATIANNLNVSIEVLQAQYSSILANMQKSNFIEDKPSSAYRRVRFQKLLNLYHNSDEKHITDLLVVYDMSLAKHLKLKSGAMDILVKLQEKNKIVVVITEGPFDAQQLTIKRLGIAPFIHHLFTSSKYKTSKTENLFSIALEKLDCAPHEMLYFGDNIKRDYYAANRLGINSFLVNENYDKGAGIKMLRNLQALLVRINHMETT